MVYNATPRALKGYFPYYFMFGRESQLPIDFILNFTPEDKTEDFERWPKEHMVRFRDAHVRADKNLKKQAAKRKEVVEKLPHSEQLQVGEKIGEEFTII